MAEQIAHGTLLKRGDGATPEVFTTIVHITSISVEMSTDVLDASNHDSANNTREKLPGYADTPTITFSGQLDPGAATHDDTSSSGNQGLFRDARARTQENWQVVFVEGDVLEGDGFVSGFSMEANDGDMLAMSGSIAYTTMPTWT